MKMWWAYEKNEIVRFTWFYRNPLKNLLIGNENQPQLTSSIYSLHHEKLVRMAFAISRTNVKMKKKNKKNLL